MKLPSRLVTSLGLVIAGVNLAGTAQAVTWTDNMYNVTVLSTNAVGVNNNHLTIANSIGADFIHHAVSDINSGGATILPPLFTSSAGIAGACAVGAVSNGSPTTAVIIGSCELSNEVTQAVKWAASNLAAPPVQLQPLPILAGLR